MWDENFWKNLKYLQKGTYNGNYEPRTLHLWVVSGLLGVRSKSLKF